MSKNFRRRDPRHRDHNRRGYPARELRKNGRKQITEYWRAYYGATDKEAQLQRQIYSLEDWVSHWKEESNYYQDEHDYQVKEIEKLKQQHDSLKKHVQAMKDALEIKPSKDKIRYSKIIRNINYS